MLRRAWSQCSIHISWKSKCWVSPWEIKLSLGTGHNLRLQPQPSFFSKGFWTGDVSVFPFPQTRKESQKRNRHTCGTWSGLYNLSSCCGEYPAGASSKSASSGSLGTLLKLESSLVPTPAYHQPLLLPVDTGFSLRCHQGLAEALTSALLWKVGLASQVSACCSLCQDSKVAASTGLGISPENSTAVEGWLNTQHPPTVSGCWGLDFCSAS